MNAGSYLRTQRALSEPTLLSAAKGVLYPHVEGTMTHRACPKKRAVAPTKVPFGFDVDNLLLSHKHITGN